MFILRRNVLPLFGDCLWFLFSGVYQGRVLGVRVTCVQDKPDQILIVDKILRVLCSFRQQLFWMRQKDKVYREKVPIYPHMTLESPRYGFERGSRGQGDLIWNLCIKGRGNDKTKSKVDRGDLSRIKSTIKQLCILN